MNPETMSDSLKKKIQKLLALSKSPNENEAMIALEKAHDLMEEYNITESDVTIVETRVRVRGKHDWEFDIAHAVSWLNGTAVIHATFRDANLRNKSEYRFYGTETDVFLTQEMYSYLVKTINRMAKKNIRKNAKRLFIESYKKGIAMNLLGRIFDKGKLYSWANKRDEKLKANRKHAQKIYENWSQNTSPKKKKDKVNKAAFHKGYVAGKNISLNHQTTGSTQKAIERMVNK